MEDTQLTLRDILGPLTDFFTKLLSKDGPQWLRAFKKFLRKENPWRSILDLIRTVQVAATGKFIAKDYFTTNSKAVNFNWLGDDFRLWFLTKVEEPQAGATLRCHRLKNMSLNESILKELGDKEETTLASIWELLKRQPRGEFGILLTNNANIFYVRDASGVPWAVGVIWVEDGWVVQAYWVRSLHGWNWDDQVFSRNS